MLRPPKIDPSHFPGRRLPQAPIVEVVVSWGHIQNVLLVAHVGAGERFVLGQDATADFVLSAEMLGATEFVLVDSGSLRVPPAVSVEDIALTAAQLRAGEVSQFSLGEFSVRVRGVRSPTRVVPRSSMDRRALVYVGGTMAFAGIMLAVMALSPARGLAMTRARLDMDSRLVRYLVEEPAYEEPAYEEPVHVSSHAYDFGIESASDPLENTAFVSGDRERASLGWGSRSSGEPVRAGVLEILERLGPTGNELSPFSNALGADPMDAISGHYDIRTGDVFGAGELGLDGVGRAGGAGEGTVHLAAIAETTHRAQYRRGLGVLAPRESRRIPVCGCGGLGEVVGSLSRAVVRRVIRRHHNEILHCYERSLLTHPELDGRVMTRFLIAPEGKVIGASVMESSLTHAETEACVTGVLLRMTFPETDGGIVRVNYPFEFRAVGP